MHMSKHDAAQYVDVTHSDEVGEIKLRSVFTSRWLLLLGRLLVPSAPVPDLLSIPLGIPCLRVNAVKETNSLLTPLHERNYIANKLKQTIWEKYLELKGMKEVENLTLKCTK